jgi:hypothetical protein
MLISSKPARLKGRHGWVTVELQEHIGVVDYLGCGLGVLGAVVDLEGLDRPGRAEPVEAGLIHQMKTDLFTGSPPYSTAPYSA